MKPRTVFGQIVKQYREDKGLTQDEVRQAMARAGAPVTQGYVSKIERGERIPNGLIVAGLATALGISNDELFGALLAQRSEAEKQHV